MTNEEAIKELKLDMGFLEQEDYCEVDMEEFDIAIKAIEENKILREEIERLDKQISESNKEGISILHDILELREENEKLKKENSELCMELTITMDKLCLVEKEIERLKDGK